VPERHPVRAELPAGSEPAEPGQDLTVEEKMSQCSAELTSQASKTPPPIESVGRADGHLGKFSELTLTFFMPSLSALRWLADLQLPAYRDR
jgi:hypothetical protein